MYSHTRLGRCCLSFVYFFFSIAKALFLCMSSELFPHWHANESTKLDRIYPLRWRCPNVTRKLNGVFFLPLHLPSVSVRSCASPTRTCLRGVFSISRRTDLPGTKTPRTTSGNFAPNGTSQHDEKTSEDFVGWQQTFALHSDDSMSRDRSRDTPPSARAALSQRDQGTCAACISTRTKSCALSARRCRCFSRLRHCNHTLACLASARLAIKGNPDPI